MTQFTSVIFVLILFSTILNDTIAESLCDKNDKCVGDGVWCDEIYGCKKCSQDWDENSQAIGQIEDEQYCYCKAGYIYEVNENGAKVCMPCVDGQRASCKGMKGENGFTHNNNPCVCEFCPSGTYFEATASDECILCPVGKYKSDEKEIQCTDCLSHTEALTVGSVVCSNCKIGMYRDDSDSVCKICEYGQFLSDNVCQECGIIHDTYCTDMQHLFQDAFTNLDTENPFNLVDCEDSMSQNDRDIEDVCDTCKCSITQDSITTNLTTIAECNGTNSYVSKITKDCEHCSIHHYIVDNECLSFSVLPVGGNMYKECVAGYNKAGAECTKCAQGKFSTSTSDKTCRICPRGLTTKYEGSIHEDDCMFCSINQYILFDENTGEYSCEYCDVCTTRREQTHMFTSCHKCQFQDITMISEKNNCVLSAMQACTTYFETDDISKKCSAGAMDLTCSSPSEPTIYTFIGKHPVDFYYNTKNINLDIDIRDDNKMQVIFFTDFKGEEYSVDVASKKYLKWIEFSNLVNQGFMRERNRLFDKCILEKFNSLDGETESNIDAVSCVVANDDDIMKLGSRTSTSQQDEHFPKKYHDVYMEQINYYKSLLEKLQPNTPGKEDKDTPKAGVQTQKCARVSNDVRATRFPGACQNAPSILLGVQRRAALECMF